MNLATSKHTPDGDKPPGLGCHRSRKVNPQLRIGLVDHRPSMLPLLDKASDEAEAVAALEAAASNLPEPQREEAVALERQGSGAPGETQSERLMRHLTEGDAGQRGQQQQVLLKIPRSCSVQWLL